MACRTDRRLGWDCPLSNQSRLTNGGCGRDLGDPLNMGDYMGRYRLTLADRLDCFQCVFGRGDAAIIAYTNDVFGIGILRHLLLLPSHFFGFAGFVVDGLVIGGFGGIAPNVRSGRTSQARVRIPEPLACPVLDCDSLLFVMEFLSVECW